MDFTFVENVVHGHIVAAEQLSNDATLGGQVRCLPHPAPSCLLNNLVFFLPGMGLAFVLVPWCHGRSTLGPPWAEVNVLLEQICIMPDHMI